MLDCNAVLTWAKENQIILGLLASAIIGSMPERLPAFREFPQWAWTWFREAAKTFLNFRRGIPTEAPAPKPPEVKPPDPKPEPPKPQLLNG